MIKSDPLWFNAISWTALFLLRMLMVLCSNPLLLIYIGDAEKSAVILMVKPESVLL